MSRRLKWRSENNFKELASPFYHLDPRNETRVINLGGRCSGLVASWPKRDSAN